MGGNPSRCRMCDDRAVCVVRLPAGCWVYPDDRVQYLCTHHYVRATPLGGMELVEDLTVGCEFTAAVSRGEL